MKELYVGIDPSINSTGVVVRENDNEFFYIIKPNKLTKKEQKFQDNSENLKFVIYEKTDLKQFNEDNHVHEYEKTLNILRIVYALESIINNYINDDTEIYVTMEGISYGSVSRTSAIYDLAGLNYLMRYILLQNSNIKRLTICPPAQVKKYVTGIGNASKDAIVNVFLSIHPEFKDTIKVDDIADAYFMSFIQ